MPLSQYDHLPHAMVGRLDTHVVRVRDSSNPRSGRRRRKIHERRTACHHCQHSRQHGHLWKTTRRAKDGGDGGRRRRSKDGGIQNNHVSKRAMATKAARMQVPTPYTLGCQQKYRNARRRGLGYDNLDFLHLSRYDGRWFPTRATTAAPPRPAPHPPPPPESLLHTCHRP